MNISTSKLRIFGATTARGGADFNLTIAYDFLQKREERRIPVQEALVDLNQTVLFGQTDFPGNQSIYLTAMAGMPLIFIDFSGNLPHAADNVPLLHHLAEPPKHTKKLNIFVFRGRMEFVPVNNEFAASTIPLQDSLPRGLVSLVKFISQTQDDAPEVLEDLSVIVAGLGTEGQQLTQDLIMDFDILFQITHPKTALEFWLMLLPMLAVNIPLALESSPSLKSLGNRLMAHKEHIIGHLINYFTGTDKLDEYTLRLSHRLIRLFNLDLGLPDGNSFVEAILAAAQQAAQAQANQEKVSKYVDLLLTSLFDENLSLKGASQSALRALVRGTRHYDLLFVSSMPQFFSTLKRYVDSIHFQENSKPTILENINSLLSNSEVREHLGRAEGFMEAVLGMAELNPARRYVLADSLNVHNQFVQAVVRAFRTRAPNSQEAPLVMEFLATTAGEVCKHSVLADVVSEVTNIDESLPLLWALMEQVCSRNDASMFVRPLFDLFSKVLEETYPEPLEKLHGLFSQSPDRAQLMSLLFQHFQFDICSVVKSDSHPGMMAIKREQTAAEAIWYMLEVCHDSALEPFRGTREFPLSVLEYWAACRLRDRQSIIYQLLTSQEFLGRLYAAIPPNDFVTLIFERRQSEAMLWYSYLFTENSLPNSLRVAGLKRVLKETFEELHTHAASIADFERRTRPVNTHQLNALLQTLNAKNDFNAANPLAVFDRFMFQHATDEILNEKSLKKKVETFSLARFLRPSKKGKQAMDPSEESRLRSAFSFDLIPRTRGMFGAGMQIENDGEAPDVPEITYLDGSLFGKDRVNARRQQITDLLRLIRQYCQGCTDREEVERPLRDLESVDCRLPVQNLFDDPLVTQLWSKHHKMVVLLSNFRHVLDIHLKQDHQAELQTFQCLRVAQERFDELLARIAHFLANFRSETVGSLKALFGKDNSLNVLECIKPYFSGRHTNNELMVSTLHFVMEFPQMVVFMNTFRVFVSQLRFKLVQAQERLKLISELEATKDSTSLGQLSQLVDRMKKGLCPPEGVSKINQTLAKFDRLSNSIEFIDSSRDQVQLMKDFAVEVVGFDVRWQDMDDLALIRDFYDKWVLAEYPDLEAVAQALRDLSSTKEFDNIVHKMEHNMSILPDLKAYREELKQNADTRFRWIMNVMENSRVQLTFVSDLRFKATLPGGNTQERRFDEMQELRNALRMKSMILAERDHAQDTPEQVSIGRFMALFQHIESIRHSRNTLATLGYLFAKDHSINFGLLKSDVSQAKAQADQLARQLTKYNELLQQAYEKSYLGTMIYGPLISVLHNLFMKETPLDTDVFYLQYLGLPRETNCNRLYRSEFQEKADTYPALFLIDFVKRELSKHSSLIPTDSVQGEVRLGTQKILTVDVSNGQLFQKVLTIGLIATRRLPRHHHLLFCCAATTLAEVVAFLHRVFASPQPEAFILVKPENLSYDVQEVALKALERLSVKNRLAPLVVLSANFECLFLQQLAEAKQLRNFEVSEDKYTTQLQAAIKQATANATLVCSDQVLSGKTHFINEQLRRDPSNPKNKVLTLTGGMDVELMVRTLEKLFQIGNLFLHVEIEQVAWDRQEELDQFLFDLIFLKVIRSREALVTAPANLRMFVEFDSSRIQNAFDYLQMTKLGINTHRVSSAFERTLLMPPTFANALDLVRHKEMSIPPEFNRSTLRPDRRIFAIDESEFWTNYVYEHLYENRNDFLRPRVLMFERILNFAVSLMLPANPSDKESQRTIITALIEMAKNLCRTGIFRIRESQDKATRVALPSLGRSMRENSLADPMLSLSSQGAPGLARQVTASPWNRTDAPIFLQVGSDSIMACRDPSVLPKELTTMLKNRNWSADGNHDSFMKQLLKLNSNTSDRGLCPKCMGFYDKTPTFCPKCYDPSAARNNRDQRRPVQRQATDDCRLLRKNDSNPSKYITAVESVYTVTTDNFMKILSIYVRAKSGLPVVIMGETGCGKTSLIRFLTTYVLDDKFDIFNVHAGTTEKDITNQVEHWFSMAQVKNPNEVRTPYWFVFDEFNTTPACGLIKSIMLTRFSGDKKFEDNVVFVATCNPYDLKNKNLLAEERVGLKRREMAARDSPFQLQYMVQPIPESLLFYTFNFGELKSLDELKYISIWLRKSLPNAALVEKVANLICDIHSFLKMNFGNSSVSLRDMKRFLTIFKFFQTMYFPIRNLLIEPAELQRKSLVLALILCYYVRLSTNQNRNRVASLIDQSFELENEESLAILQKEQRFLLSELRLEAGVAHNNALSENLFTMFVCVLNKVPLLICGKPGSSKSLSVQLLFNQMKGGRSLSTFLAKFPELVAVPYQGSEASTSRNVQAVFEKAEKAVVTQEGQQPDKLAVVVFDEIGLAEISKNNPLKVLHFKLEIENIRVGFVGISNWQLDASKMNRVLCLSRRDPDLNELEETARAIGASIVGDKTEAIQPKLTQLSKLYSDLYQHLTANGEDSLYGLRDFYSLVKNVANSYARFVKQTPKASDRELHLHIYRAVLEAILRNFNADKADWRSIWQSFCNMNDADRVLWEPLHPPTLEALLHQNLSEALARPVMVVTKRPQIHSRVYEIMKSARLPTTQGGASRQYRVMVGSLFPDDVASEAYLVRSINEVIMYMEQPLVLLVHQFNAIFTSLYDLFNQNFRRHGQTNFCRIIQGSFGKSSYPVHDHFKVIVFMTPEDLAAADAPLINRFEKYFLDDQNGFFDKAPPAEAPLRSLLSTLFPNPSDPELRKCIANYSPNTLYEWSCRADAIAQARGLDPADSQVIREVVFLVANLRLSMRIFQNIPVSDRPQIQSEFLANKRATFADVLANSHNSPSLLTFDVTYTFTSPYVALEGPFSTASIREVCLETFKEERELRSCLQVFFREPTPHAHFVLKVDGSRETKHLYSIQHMVASVAEEATAGVPKHLHIVVSYKQQNIQEAPAFFVERQWTARFVDDLLQTPPVTIMEILQHPETKTSLERFHKLSRERIDRLIDRVFEEITFHSHDDSVLKRVEFYYANFEAKYGAPIAQFLVDFVFDKCRTDPELATSSTVFDLVAQQRTVTTTNFAETVEEVVQAVFTLKLTSVVRWIETNMMINPLYQAATRKKEDLIELWMKLFKKYFNTADSADASRAVPVFHHLNFPMSMREHQSLAAFNQDTDSRSWASPHEIAINLASVKAKDFFWRFHPADITTWSSEWHALMVADLVYLHLSSLNEFNVTSGEVLQLLEWLLPDRLSDVFAYFVSHPTLISFHFLLFNSFRTVFGLHASARFKETISHDLTVLGLPAVLQTLTERLIRKVMDRDSFHSHHASIFKESIRLQRVLGVIQQATNTRLAGFSQLSFWLDFLGLTYKFSDPAQALDDVIRPIGWDFSQIFDGLQFGEQLFLQIQATVVGMPNSSLQLPELVCDFEVVYYQHYLNVHSDTNLLIAAFGQAFARLETNPILYLHANPLVDIFKRLSGLQAAFKTRWEQETKTPSPQQIQLLEWLSPRLYKWTERLPFLLINKLVAVHEWGGSFDQILNLTPQLTDRIVDAFLSLEEKASWTLERVLIIAAVRLVASQYATEILKSGIDVKFVQFRKRLAQPNVPRLNSLHIFVIKSLGVGVNLGSVIINDPTIQKYLVHEKAQVQNAECIPTNDPVYLEFSRKLEENTPISRRLDDMLTMLTKNSSALAYWSFYLVFINKTQLSFQWTRNMGAELIKSLTQGEQKSQKILGGLGHALMLTLGSNFTPGSRFEVLPESPEARIRQNINILAAFAFWLAQRFANNYLTSALYGSDVDWKSLFERVNSTYLPGAILPGNNTLGYMMVIRRGSNNIIYRCNQKCLFYYEFQNCQQANSQVGFVPRCMICDRPLGAITNHGELYKGQIRLDRAAAMKEINEHMEKFLIDNFKPGLCDLPFVVTQGNNYNLNVDERTTAFLHFVSTSLVAGLHALGACEPQLTQAFGDLNPSRVLANRFDAFFTFMGNSFRGQDSSVVLNALLAGLTRIPLGSSSNTSFRHCLELEREVEKGVINQAYNDSAGLVRNYKQELIRATKLNKQTLSISSVVEEIQNHEDIEAEFPLISYLRRGPTRATLEQFLDRFSSRLEDERRKFPMTIFFRDNLTELANLRLTVLFKAFYDPLCDSIEGKINLPDAEAMTIASFLEDHPNLADPFEKFQDVWNETVLGVATVDYECDSIPLKKVETSHRLVRILPQISRNQQSDDIYVGLGAFIVFQNKMVQAFLSAMGEQSTGKAMHNWRHISRKTVFEYTQAGFEDYINQECVKVASEFGGLGVAEFNFPKFEGFLARRVFELGSFVFPLVPAFRFADQSVNFVELLITVRNSGFQEALPRDKELDLRKALDPVLHPSRPGFLNDMWNFLQSILLPRAVHFTQAQLNMTVREFLEGLVSKGGFLDDPVFAPVSNLPMIHLYSLVRVVELLRFREQFDKVDLPPTALETNPNTADWREAGETFKQSMSQLLFATNSGLILDALSLVVVRNAFSPNLNWPLSTFLTENEIVWPVDFDPELMAGLKIDDRLQLRHALLAQRLLKEERDSHIRVSSNTRPRGLQAIDAEDQVQR